ncbi:MAG: protein phosphatase 2C domain-containing protein [Candidatus Nanohaloarchaea archaeon]|nr:protein phosphatase 2C domain-containing protein [Candidatus Nanohaloarchaea archaeon]
MEKDHRVEVVYDKGSGEINEDNYLVQDRTFGVFDGTSSLIEKYRDEKGGTGGYLASSIARDAFRDSGSLKDLALEANSRVLEEMDARGIDTSDKANLWATTAAAVRIEDDSFKWLQIRDSPIMAVMEDGSYELMVDQYDHDEETLMQWKELAERGVENIREGVEDKLIEVRRQMNIDYGCINGEEGLEQFINTGKRALKDVDHILMFTDGLIPPKQDTKAEDDFSKFVEIYRRNGLQEVKEQIRQKEREDPECRKYPRFKTHDDIAAIAITFE